MHDRFTCTFIANIFTCPWHTYTKSRIIIHFPMTKASSFIGTMSQDLQPRFDLCPMCWISSQEITNVSRTFIYMLVLMRLHIRSIHCIFVWRIKMHIKYMLLALNVLQVNRHSHEIQVIFKSRRNKNTEFRFMFLWMVDAVLETTVHLKPLSMACCANTLTCKVKQPRDNKIMLIIFTSPVSSCPSHMTLQLRWKKKMCET